MLSYLDFAFLFFVGAFLPWIIIKSARQEEKVGIVLPSKEKAIISTMVFLALTGGLAIFTASRRGMTLFGPWRLSATEVAAGVGLLLVLLYLRHALAPWMRLGQRPNAMYLRPKEWKDLPLWTLLSCCAGFFEEIVYRGVLYQILLGLSGSVVVSVSLACVVFGVVHLRQGYRAVLFITLLSVSLHGLVIGFGTLYMAMIVHAAYDILAGIRSIRSPSN